MMTYIERAASNAHIAKIAALPRVDRSCVFSQPLLALIKCLECSNFGNMPNRYRQFASDSTHNKKNNKE